MPLNNYRKRYPNELSISVAGTAVDGTFTESVDVLSIRPDIDIWLDESDVSSTGDGLTLNVRVRVFSGERRFIPWHANTIRVVNAISGETGNVYAEGWVL